MSDHNAIMRKQNEVFTGFDETIASNALEIIIPDPGAGNRIVVVGICLSGTAGTGTNELLSVTGSIVRFKMAFAIGTDREVNMDISSDIVNQAVTVKASADNLTAGFLTVSWRIQRES